MALAAGSRIGHYEIVAPLGAGGMGEVYRARDPKLDRDVALKLLLPEVAGDRERLVRFDREARILASVNHPNIAAIHGLAESEFGPALVLELVDGPTLEDRLATGALALEDVLRFARQIADALEAAHELGIVHRDLKPANIKIRSDGTVKVLDFGIAKILDPDDQERPAQQATVTATEKGVLIGTTAYMSPEHARGAVVTRRSDVWAFGAILFEMLTGKRAFSGSTTSDVIAAILQGTPDWSALPPSTPAAIARLIRRCLEREPKARLHDIGDARLEIEDAERAWRSEGPLQAQAAAARGGAGPLSRRAILGAAVLIAAAALALAVYIFSSRSEDSAQEVRLQMSAPSGMHFVSVPAVSPDGRQIVFVAVPDAGGNARLWLRPFAAAAPTELPGTAGAIYPFWSADNRSVAFFADGRLKRVSVAGGNPIIVCEAPVGRGGLWLDDDTIVFAPTAFSRLMRVQAAGGQPEAFTTLADDETGHRFPQRLPGRQLLYYSVNRTPEKSGTRLVTIADPRQPITFIPTFGAAEYVKGFLVFVPMTPGSRSSVLAQRMTLPGGDLTGEPIEIGQARISETMGRFVTATSPTGVVAILGPIDAIGQFTWMSRDGRVLDNVGTPTSQLGVELSPDGQQVATYRSGEVWTINLARPVPTRVAPGFNRHPMWSPDGARLLSLFQGRGIGTFDLVATSVATGEVETVRQAKSIVRPSGWTRDGRMVWTEAATGQSSIWMKPAGGEPASIRQGVGQTFEARVSPDGRWIAYSSDRSGRFEIEVSSFPEAGQRYPVSVDGGGYPRWRADGRELYFLSADSRLMSATFAAGTPPTIGIPAPLFEVRLIAHPDRGNFAEYEYDVNADGSRFLINRMVSPPDASMTVIVDWNPRRQVRIQAGGADR
jgi:eukaryotic-like serine/threonine-protein kinase